MKKFLLALFILVAFINGCIKEPIDQEKSLVELINEYREEQGLYLISESKALNHVADIHIDDLVDNYTLNDECNLHSWSENGDWSSCCYTPDHAQASCMWDKPRELSNYTGEGYEIAVFSSNGMDVNLALSLWKKSEVHHNLIVNKGIWEAVEWKAIGGAIKGDYAVIWFGQESDLEN